MESASSYIRIQAGICAVINVIVNPAISWFCNRGMKFTPLTDIAIDMTITCLVMSTAIALFTTSGVRQAIKAGKLKADDGSLSVGIFSRLPRSWWSLGLLLGIYFLIILIPITFGTFTLFGYSGLSFTWLLIFKAIYTGAVAFAVASLIILHQMKPEEIDRGRGRSRKNR